MKEKTAMILDIHSKCRSVCGAVILLALALSGVGCSVFTKTADPMADFEASLSSSKQVLEAGETTSITVNARRPPQGMLYKWTATAGQCNPQESKESRTTEYKAPDQLSDNKDFTVTVKVEFILDGKPRGDKAVEITVKGNQAAVPPITKPSIPTVDSKPTIRITLVPPYSTGGPEGIYKIAGQVSGVPVSEYRVVLYAQADYWFIQPFNVGELRFTEIESDGSFTNQTHGGIKYAALLVRKSFTTPPVKIEDLPGVKDVVASDIVKGAK
jgi:hypothetical protein